MPIYGGNQGPMGAPMGPMTVGNMGPAPANHRPSTIQTFNSSTGTGSKSQGTTNPSQITPPAPGQRQKGKGTGPLSEIRDQGKKMQELFEKTLEIDLDNSQALKKVAQIFEEMESGSKSMRKNFKGVRDSIVDIVEEIDEVGDQLKAVSKLTKQINRDGLLESQTVEEASEFMEDLLRQLKEVKKNAVTDPIKFKGSIKEIEAAEAALHELQMELDGVGDKSVKVSSTMSNKFDKATRDMGRSMREFRKQQSSLTKEVREEWSDVFKSVTGSHQKFFDTLSKSGKAMKGFAKLVGLDSKGLVSKGKALKEASQDRLEKSAKMREKREQAWKGDPRGITAQMFSGIKGLAPARNALLNPKKRGPIRGYSHKLNPKIQDKPQPPQPQPHPKEGDVVDPKRRSRKVSSRKRVENPLPRAEQHMDASKSLINPSSKMNPLRNLLFSRGMKANSLKEMGWLGRTTIGGGGSLSRGVGGKVGDIALKAGSKVGGAMEAVGGLGSRGMGALGGIAGRALPFIAIAKGVMDLADKTAEMNKQVEAATAQGGLFGGSGRNGVLSGFNGIRNFASSGGFDMNFYGQTMEKNLNVMKAMIEEGFSLDKSIVSGSGMNVWGSGPGSLQDVLKDYKEGTNNSTTGAVFHNATFGSRTLGISQEESVKLTTQLMTKYQQSAKDTTTFFEQVSKESAVAGISTTKYIDIIQSLSDKMGDLNSSFVQVVMTIEKLGKSGRFTADQLKSMGETMLTGGKNVGPEYLAYMFKKGGLGDVRKGADADEKIAAMQFQGGLKTPGAKAAFGEGFDITKYRDNIGAVESMLDQAARSGKVEGLEAKNLQGMISQYKTAVQQRKAMSGNAVSAGLAVDAMGSGAAGSVNTTYQLLKRMSGDAHIKGGVNALLENPGEALASGNGMGAMYLQQYLKMNPKALEDISRYSSGMANATVSTMAGEDEEAKSVRKKVLGSMSAQDKKRFGLTGKDAEDKLKNLSATGTTMQKGELADAMRGNIDLLQDIVSGSESAAQYLSDQNSQQAKWQEEEKARAAESATKTTAEIFARSFEYLFNKLFNPLTALRNWFLKDSESEKDKIAKSTDWLTGDKMKEYVELAQSKLKTMESDLAAIDKDKGLTKEQKDAKKKELSAKIANQRADIAEMGKLNVADLDTWDKYSAAANQVARATQMTDQYRDKDGNIVSESKAVFGLQAARDLEQMKSLSEGYGANIVAMPNTLDKLKEGNNLSADAKAALVASQLYGFDPRATNGGMQFDANQGNMYMNVSKNVDAKKLQQMVDWIGKDKASVYTDQTTGQKSIVYNVYGANFREFVSAAGVPLSKSAEGAPDSKVK